jgi:hypothetical protein
MGLTGNPASAAAATHRSGRQPGPDRHPPLGAFGLVHLSLESQNVSKAVISAAT